MCAALHTSVVFVCVIVFRLLHKCMLLASLHTHREEKCVLDVSQFSVCVVLFLCRECGMVLYVVCVGGVEEEVTLFACHPTKLLTQCLCWTASQNAFWLVTTVDDMQKRINS